MHVLFRFFMFILLITLLACTTGYKIKEGTPKATLRVSITNHVEKTGFSSLFSPQGSRLEIHSYDKKNCKLKDKVINVSGINSESKIDIPVGKPLYLFYTFTSTDSYFTNFAKSSCTRPFAFVPAKDHKYQFVFKLKSNKCISKVYDITKKRRKAKMVKIPKSCIKKYSVQ